MDNQKNPTAKIEAVDLIKLAHVDVLEELIKNSSDKAFKSDSREVENFAQLVADEYRELFVKSFLERYETQVANYVSFASQVRQ